MRTIKLFGPWFSTLVVGCCCFQPLGHLLECGRCAPGQPPDGRAGRWTEIHLVILVDANEPAELAGSEQRHGFGKKPSRRRACAGKRENERLVHDMHIRVLSGWSWQVTLTWNFAQISRTRNNSGALAGPAAVDGRGSAEHRSMWASVRRPRQIMFYSLCDLSDGKSRGAAAAEACPGRKEDLAAASSQSRTGRTTRKARARTPRSLADGMPGRRPSRWGQVGAARPSRRAAVACTRPQMRDAGRAQVRRALKSARHNRAGPGYATGLSRSCDGQRALLAPLTSSPFPEPSPQPWGPARHHSPPQTVARGLQVVPAPASRHPGGVWGLLKRTWWTFLPASAVV